MKLSTAYRKLAPHRNRWHLEIRTAAGADQYYVIARYQLTRAGTTALPPSLYGDCVDQDNFTIWRIYARGLANAMAAMADKLDRVELAITKHNEAVKAAEEAKQ